MEIPIVTNVIAARNKLLLRIFLIKKNGILINSKN
jgi:hypothetical protein